MPVLVAAHLVLVPKDWGLASSLADRPLPHCYSRSYYYLHLHLPSSLLPEPDPPSYHHHLMSNQLQSVRLLLLYPQQLRRKSEPSTKWRSIDF